MNTWCFPMVFPGFSTFWTSFNYGFPMPKWLPSQILQLLQKPVHFRVQTALARTRRPQSGYRPWGPRSIAKLVYNSNNYGLWYVNNYSIHGVYKATYNYGLWHYFPISGFMGGLWMFMVYNSNNYGKYSMVYGTYTQMWTLEYAHQPKPPTIWPSFVGKYSSTMEHLGMMAFLWHKPKLLKLNWS